MDASSTERLVHVQGYFSIPHIVLLFYETPFTTHSSPLKIPTFLFSFYFLFLLEEKPKRRSELGADQILSIVCGQINPPASIVAPGCWWFLGFS